MALNNLKCNHLTPLGLKGLMVIHSLNNLYMYTSHQMGKLKKNVL